MPRCFAIGCSNRSDKDPEKRFKSFYRLPDWQKSQAAPASSECTSYYGKHLRMSTFVMITSQGIVTKSVYTDTNCWVPRQGRGIVEAYYRRA